ncbi:substrate-binding periplasmic protein [Marinomonas pollencensis]|uniref:Amino acid ABC transporter substrate-binding protein (PAAT family) n=1 Tax=Marinomonas pollencensis TaxID=491954 RepID=A0A3E0DHQ3_9GAMM|nr:transporter substrate-binding domain-containing protein [Marinomonas pollencensis]REG81008.1 amino acid ABC transporter substrate-binding protein (PAAT family) [Marinomonas pollencensis]
MKYLNKSMINGLLLIIGLCCQGASAKTQHIVLYGVHFPPYMIDASIMPATESENKGQAVYGMDVDLVRQAYATQGVTVTFQLMPWKRSMRNVAAGVGLGAVSCRPLLSRKKFAFFSQKISQFPSVFVTRNGYFEAGAYPMSIAKTEQTMAMNGWAQATLLEQAHIAYHTVGSVEQGLNLLLHRDQNVFLTARAGAEFEARRLGIEDQLSFYEVSDLTKHYYTVCFSKQYPNAEKWRDILDKGLDEVRKNGEWQAIVGRYRPATVQ